MKSIPTTVDNCIVFQRGVNEERVYVICNMSDRNINFPILNELDLSQFDFKRGLIDNLSGSYLNTDTFKLNPYQVVWVSITD